MIPNTNNIVKIHFKSGLQLTGKVEKWAESEAILISSDGECRIIIPHPSDDIVAILILPDRANIKQKIVAKEEEKVILEKKLEETLKEPSGDNLRVKKLAELRILLAEQDKKIITDKLKDHHLPAPKEASYGYPRFYKKPSTK